MEDLILSYLAAMESSDSPQCLLQVGIYVCITLILSVGWASYPGYISYDASTGRTSTMYHKAPTNLNSSQGAKSVQQAALRRHGLIQFNNDLI